MKLKAKLLAALFALCMAALMLTGCSKPVKIELKTENVITSIQAGDEIDLSGLKINVTYDDGKTSEIAVNAKDVSVDLSSLDNTKEGTYTIKVTYKELQADLTVTVTQAIETGFEIDRADIAENVDLNGTIDITKLKVYALYEKLGRRLLSANEYTVNASSFDSSKYGQNTITVTYKEYSAQTFTVNVVASVTNTEDDGNTYVLYSHIPYGVTGGTNLVLTDSENNPIETLGDSALPVLASGNYTLNYINSKNESRTKTLKVVDYLQNFGYGDDYSVYKDTLSKIGTQNNKYKKTTADEYCVGTANGFYFDIKLLGPRTNIIADTRLLEYKFFVYENGNYNEITNMEDVAAADGNKFTFNNTYLGKKIKVTVNARYNEFSNPLIFEFVLDNGYNVFTNADLKDKFGDLSVTKINIHREIIAELYENQYNPDGTPKNIEDGATANYYSFDTNNKLINNTGNVYARFSNSTTSNALTLNGNYFNINGQNIPLLVPDIDDKYADQPGTLDAVGQNVETQISNSQSTIFHIYMSSGNYDANLLATADTVARQDFNALEGNKVTFNNLTILSNTVTPSGDVTEEEAMRIVYENSGGYAGIKNSMTDIEVNNSVIRFACIGIFAVNSGADSIINDCIIEESWANNIYGWSSSYVQITNSDIRNAGGAAIWMDDLDYRNGEVYDPQVTVDGSTKIENFVVGSEAWFNAQAMSNFAKDAKASLAGAVTEFTQGTYTIIKDIYKGEVKFETFNFAIIIMDRYKLTDENDYAYQADRQKCEVDGVTMQRTYEDLDKNNNAKDYRVLPDTYGNVFIAPVNMYSSKEAFNTLLSQTPGQAFGLAMYQCFATPDTKYVEIVLPAGSGLGTLTLITEYFPTNT